MKEIKLTQGKVALVDDEDFERVNQYKWYAHFNKGDFYAYRKESVFDFTIDEQIYPTIRMTNTILNTTEMIDHKNHDTLDNQKHNLRTCTKSQNGQNQKPQKNCTSKYKGVSLYKQDDKWHAEIRLRNIFNLPFKRYLGRFKNEVEAAKAYDKVAKEEFGEFAYLNFKEE